MVMSGGGNNGDDYGNYEGDGDDDDGQQSIEKHAAERNLFKTGVVGSS